MKEDFDDDLLSDAIELLKKKWSHEINPGTLSPFNKITKELEEKHDSSS